MQFVKELRKKSAEIWQSTTTIPTVEYVAFYALAAITVLSGVIDLALIVRDY